MQLELGSRAYDNSMLDSFRACPRKHLLCNILNWRSEVKSHDLAFGLCWHSAMDVIWLNADKPVSDDDLLIVSMAAFMDTWYKNYPAEKDQDSMFAGSEDERYPKTPGRARDMLFHYIRRKRPTIAKYEILGVETPFIVPLPMFDKVFYVGRKDKTARIEGRGVVDFDHKTSKSDGQRWADTFFPNSQMDGYLYSGFMQYGEEYWGVEIDGALCQKGSAKTAREDYPPGIGFSTVPIQRGLAFVESWLWDTQYLIKQIEAHEAMLAECKPEDNFLKAFEKHTTACGYFKGCEYRNICKYYENPLRLEEPPRGYIIEKWSPFDVIDAVKQISDGAEE